MFLKIPIGLWQTPKTQDNFPFKKMFKKKKKEKEKRRILWLLKWQHLGLTNSTQIAPSKASPLFSLFLELSTIPTSKS